MSNGITAGAGQYLSFTLGEDTFAVDIHRVREVFDLIRITKVPRTPDTMLGVINLRGSVIPVMDMRLKFGIPPTEKTINTCIVILEAIMEGEEVVVGALVDSVQEVFELEANQIEPPPRIGTWLKTEFIKGMGKRSNDDFIIILNIDRVFSSQESIADRENDSKESKAPADKI